MNTIDKIRAEIERRQRIHYNNAGLFSAGQFAEDTDLLNFLDTLQEECLADESKTLDEVAEIYAEDEIMSGLAEHYFKVGAKWAMERGVSWTDRIYYCEGCLLLDEDESIHLESSGFKSGDKVIVQIRKRDE